MAMSTTHSKMHTLLADNDEWDQALEEADVWALGR
jgi:hypothetical protein